MFVFVYRLLYYYNSHRQKRKETAEIEQQQTGGIMKGQEYIRSTNWGYLVPPKDRDWLVIIAIYGRITAWNS